MSSGPVAKFYMDMFLPRRHIHHDDRGGLQDPDGGRGRGEGEAADLGHGRTGALPHHHINVSAPCIASCKSCY